MAVKPRGDVMRRQIGPPVTDMSISACPSIRPRSPRSALRRVSEIAGWGVAATIVAVATMLWPKPTPQTASRFVIDLPDSVGEGAPGGSGAEDTPDKERFPKFVKDEYEVPPGGRSDADFDLPPKPKPKSP